MQFVSQLTGYIGVDKQDGCGVTENVLLPLRRVGGVERHHARAENPAPVGEHQGVCAVAGQRGNRVARAHTPHREPVGGGRHTGLPRPDSPRPTGLSFVVEFDEELTIKVITGEKERGKGVPGRTEFVNLTAGDHSDNARHTPGPDLWTLPHQMPLGCGDRHIR